MAALSTKSIFALSRLLLLVLSFLAAPHSFDNCMNYCFPNFDRNFFFSLGIMGLTLIILWVIIKRVKTKKDGPFFLRIGNTIEKVCERYPYLILSLSCLFLWTAISATSFFLFDHVPRVSDEIAQLFQAKIFHMGRLYADPPPIPDFFTYAEDNIIVHPRWYCQYPPGFPFLLMLGIIAGSPWIVNPLLASGAAIVIYLFCSKLYTRTTALWSAFLFSVSPKVIVTAASLMNHTAAMFFLLCSVALLVYSCQKKNSLLAFCSGITLGWSFNIRSLDAVVLFAPVGVYTIFKMLPNWRHIIKLWGFWFLGFGIMLGVLCVYNYFTTGDPLLSGYIVRWGTDHYLGFHEVRGGWKHTPYRGLLNTIRQIRISDKSLFEWPLPVTFFILLSVFYYRYVWDYILLTIIVLNIGIYFFWGWSDTLFMGRFYFNSLPYVVILTCRGLQALCNIMYGTLRQSSPLPQGNGVLLLAICLLFSIGIPLHAPDFSVQYIRPELHVDRRIETEVMREGLTNALVFIETQDKHELIVGSGFFMNTPALAAQNIIFAKDLGVRNIELMRVFPDRAGFLYRHRLDVPKLFNKDGYCMSSPEAFELVPIKEVQR